MLEQLELLLFLIVSLLFLIDIYLLLFEYHKALAAYNIQGERSYGKKFCRATIGICRETKAFVCKIRHIILQCLFSRMKAKHNIFSVLQISLKSCNICQLAISRNIGDLHHIDLYCNLLHDQLIQTGSQEI